MKEVFAKKMKMKIFINSKKLPRKNIRERPARKFSFGKTSHDVTTTAQSRRKKCEVDRWKFYLKKVRVTLSGVLAGDFEVQIEGWFDVFAVPQL